MTGNVVIYTVYQILFGYEIKEDKMGGTCNTHGRDDQFRISLLSKGLKVRGRSGDLGGSIILKYMLRNRMWESALYVGYMVVIAASSWLL
jgi:hypothetical protein